MDNNNYNNSHTKNYFASPALSLSLAGVFRNAGAVAAAEVEEGDEGSGGGGYCRVDQVENSSENNGLAGQSDDEEGIDGSAEEDEEVENKKKKKRKKYHRHTVEQIRVMEALFKESPHPDEKQRQQLSKQLGLSPRQVKFWFQNRRTQIKAIQERHENSLLKSEMDKLREENRAMRETIKKACCPNCGFATSNNDTAMTTEEQQLRIENARLKAEIEKLRGMQGKVADGASSPSSSFSAGTNQNTKSSFDYYTGFFGLEKSRILELVNSALDELTKMASYREPLWIRSIETGREILNYDEYICQFSPDTSQNKQPKISIEASRESGIVFLDIARLVQAFMDVMFAELQMLTPTVPTRELYFVRYCKKLTPDRWAIVDVSVDKIEENIDASLEKCRKNPSGCIIEDQANGHCKVTWVEHIECQKIAVPTMYRSIVINGLAFGARHWMATLQLHCERIVFFMATNVPTKDSNGVSTLAGRKSILKLAHRMSLSFCHNIGASRYNTWQKVSKGGEDIRVTTRKNINEPGEPQGLVACVVLSTWLPLSSIALFDFLRDESRRTEWDITLSGSPTQTIVNLAKGQHRGNSVTVHKMKSAEKTNKWLLQDSSTNAYESIVVYTELDADSLQSVMTGCDSSKVAVLPYGFSILPDGLETKPLLITMRKEEKSSEGGSLLTVAYQFHANSSPLAKLTTEFVENVTSLVSCTLLNIKKAFQCEDG
ncbi:homeobox-leucine zipper protein GLABRA 2 isoform X2 [Ananas comosus]|uniref:Homeobox-leucine zipper protein GLABRA 2 isoform X2 n=1 Tax=Ananas comosus TaxID=4615 RepID=A0A6P5FRD8_ANACO|nr:homeobox-leucine zipper protein GLABRA 2 isoform X2 [Ananas comosus]